MIVGCASKHTAFVVPQIIMVVQQVVVRGVQNVHRIMALLVQKVRAIRAVRRAVYRRVQHIRFLTRSAAAPSK